MFCKKCGTSLQPGVRFCKKCGTPTVAATAPEAPNSAPLYQFSQPAPVYEQAPVFPPAKTIPRYAPVLVGVALLALLGGVYYWYSHVTLERQLEDALTKGNLLKPAGASAFDYFQKLKQGGLSESKRQQLEVKLSPLVTARPLQMINDLAAPNSRAETTLADWHEAQTLLEWARELRPQDKNLEARTSYCAGRVAYLSNRKDEALTYWKRAAEQDATWALPLNGSGLIHNERKNYPLARSFFLEAIRREPQFALPYNNLGTSFFYEKDDSQAENYYRQAIERAPQWPRPHAWLAEIALRRKDYQQAVTEFQTVLDLDPSGTSGIDVSKIRQQLEQARQMAQQADNPALQFTPGPIR